MKFFTGPVVYGQLIPGCPSCSKTAPMDSIKKVH